METLLIAITLLSVTAATVATVIAWRLARDARALAAARLAALSAAAGPAPTPIPLDAPAVPATAVVPVAPIAAQRTVPVTTVPEPMSTTRDLDDFMPAPTPVPVRAPAPVAVDDRFMGVAGRDAERGGPQRWLAAAAVVLLVVLLGVTFTRGGSRASSADATPATATAAPLELVSMRHDWRDGQLSVEGDVRAPGGRTPAGLEAVALLFGRDGGLVTTAVAPVAPGLTPDQPAHFVVALPAPASAARYRVSFRAAGTMVPHVDLRAAGTTPAGQVSVNR